jgi:transcriptional regulator with XRE-family HTH domain
MKSIHQLRDALRALLSATGMAQVELARRSGVDQASLSRFLRDREPEGLSGNSVLRLLPFINGEAPPEGSADPPE